MQSDAKNDKYGCVLIENVKHFLTVYGYVAVDTITIFDSEKNAQNSYMGLGGTGSNISVGAARLGTPVALCSQISRNLPSEMLSLIVDSNVNIEDVTFVAGDPVRATVTLDGNAHDSTLYLDSSKDCLNGYNPIGSAMNSEYVHFSTGNPLCYIDIIERMNCAKVAFDPSRDIYLWNKELLCRAIKKTDILFCNRYEEQELKEKLGDRQSDVKQIDLFVVTKDSEGSVAYTNGDKIEIPIYDTNSIDPTGAGDAYRSGFYAATYRGFSIIESLVIGSALSSFCVERIGTLTYNASWDAILDRAEKIREKVGTI
jgi:ribokinase